MLETHPDLLGEAVHIQLYTMHWRQPEAYFSFAYRNVCDWLYERGERDVDTGTKSDIVGYVTSSAASVYSVDAGQIAFSANSVDGAKNWLKALDPPVLSEANRFCRRGASPMYTLLWGVDGLYHHPDCRRDYGVRMPLDERSRDILCRVCLLEPEALESVLEVARQTYDWRRPGGFFGTGLEGGFGRWLILSRPMPPGAIEPL